MALQLLVFAAINTVHITDRFDINVHDDIDEPDYYYLHQTCEIANLTIVELLESQDIHEYQKYILLRCLFKNPNGLELAIDNYDIKTIHFNFFDGLSIKKTLPFRNQVLEIASKLTSTATFYPLKMICEEIGNISMFKEYM